LRDSRPARDWPEGSSCTERPGWPPFDQYLPLVVRQSRRPWRPKQLLIGLCGQEMPAYRLLLGAPLGAPEGAIRAPPAPIARLKRGPNCPDRARVIVAPG
jgi:hypothetical protein